MSNLSSFSSQNLFIQRYYSSLRSFMGFLIRSLSLGFTLLAPLKFNGFTTSPNWYTPSEKSSSNGCAFYPKLSSDDVFTKTFNRVEPDNFINVKNLNNPQLTITPITNIHTTCYKGLVYNITVDEDESYTIGSDNIVVHNCVCEWEVIYDFRDIIEPGEEQVNSETIK